MSSVAVAGRAPSRASREDITRVYVWEVPVRIAHWLIAGSIIVLAATGIYIGHPFIIVSGEARNHHVMALMKSIHFTTAIVFTTALLMRLIWWFSGNMWAQWHQFFPVDRSRRRSFWGTLKFYTFFAKKPPAAIGHNPIAGVTYLAVFGLYFLVIGTGLALYATMAPVGSLFRHFTWLLTLFGGAQTARWIHHVIMWLLLGFMVHHVYSALLMSHVEKTGCLESIFSGYKFVPRDEYEKERAEVRRKHRMARD
jgi:Ni/Fe-hydrogenase 1 B-type cytochrome subunit